MSDYELLIETSLKIMTVLIEGCEYRPTVALEEAQKMAKILIDGAKQ